MTDTIATEQPVGEETKPPRLGSFLLAAPSLGGTLGGALFWWFSLTPTLLPRSWLSQAVVSGISVAIGYGIGTGIQALIGWVWRRTSLQVSDRVRRWSWITVIVVAVVAAAAGAFVWSSWQNESRDLVELPHASALTTLPMLGLTILVFAILLLLGRLIGWLLVRVDTFIDRFVPTWASRLLTLVLLGVIVSVLAGGAGKELVNVANGRFGAADTGTEDGVVQPTATTVSGSPESEAAWDTLGSQGRTFVAQASTEADLRAFAADGATINEAIRVYAGVLTEEDVQARADLVVAELERTGAFDREVLVVVTTTGTGWVDPDAARAIELMHNGDTAIAGMQYSFFPSWISFLVDGEKSAEAGIAIDSAVHDAWAALPEDDRPRLILFGESLGSLGSEDAFADSDIDNSLRNVTARSDGVLWIGPTYSNPIWEQMIRSREAGSPIWRATYSGGRTARVGNRPEDFEAVDTSWGPTRVAWYHHPSDPVGYWNWGLLYDPPEWINDPIGYDVSPRTGWFPIVTFNAVVADLIAGFSAPSGYGHNYAIDVISGWAAVAPPQGWTDADTVRLEQHLHLGD